MLFCRSAHLGSNNLFNGDKVLCDYQCIVKEERVRFLVFSQQVYFYWICRDPSAFEWFADLLLSLETRMSEQGKTHLLSYHIFLTGWDENQVSIRL